MGTTQNYMIVTIAKITTEFTVELWSTYFYDFFSSIVDNVKKELITIYTFLWMAV